MSDMNKIVTRIENALNHLTSKPSGQNLLRVPNHLRRVKNEAYEDYEPHKISIGPYHRGKNHLAAMEEHKFRYLKRLLQRRDDSSIAKYVEAFSELNERAKNSYGEQFLEERQPGDFLETMLVDACFIVELIRKGVATNLSIEDDDPIFRSEMTLYSLKQDLLLLENQLPFFILQELFDMTLLPNEESNLVDMIFSFFRILPGPGYKRGEEHNLPKVPVSHLLGLVHDNWLPSPQGLKAYLNMTDQEKQEAKCLVCLSIGSGLISSNEASKEDDEETPIPCATVLHEAGINFRMANGCSIFDIKFANGILEIPRLTIQPRTESLMKNLIAYEKLGQNDIYQVIEYAKFMGYLINSSKDVELLCRSGIIENWLGDDEVIANMFNRFRDNFSVQEGSVYIKVSFYSEINKRVNKYCGRKWNMWIAKLRHDYFGGPWSFKSFISAAFLLLLTVLQTVYSVISYHYS